MHAITGKADGVYRYTVIAYNHADRSNTGNPVVITIIGPKVPSAPSITTKAYRDTDGNYSINWTRSERASGYNLYEGGSTLYNGTNLTMALFGKANGTYTYTAAAWNENGTSLASSPVSVIVTNIPAAPTIVTAPYESWTDSYSICWLASIYASGYNLSENGKVVYSGSNLSKSFSGRSDGTYAYAVVAYNANGASSANGSVAISVLNPKHPTTPVIITNSYTCLDGEYSICWTRPDYVSGYDLTENGAVVYRGPNPTKSFSGKADGAYTYRVMAWNENGTTPYSGAVTITVTNVPPAPTITTEAYASWTGAYNINWTASAYASGYNLTENGVVVYSAAALTKSFLGRADGTYAYTAVAWNIYGESSESDVVKVVVLNPKLPGMPHISTRTYKSPNGTYSINWTVSAYASGYNLTENGALIYSGPATTYSFLGRLDGAYTYALNAFNINGTSEKSNEVTIIVNKMPTDIAITTKAYMSWDGTYKINWTTSDYAFGYELSENGMVIYNGTGRALQFTSTSVGIYAYAARGWNAYGAAPWSAVIVIRVPGLPTTPSITTTTYTDHDGNYDINWTFSDYVDSYVLYEDGTVVYNGTHQTYSVANKSGGTYFYAVRAQNSNGTSCMSLSVIVKSGAPTLPFVPFITTVGYIDRDGSYSVNWSRPAYAYGYELSENGTTIYNGTGTEYQLTNKSNGAYTYMVRAWNENGTSARSDPATVRVIVPKTAWDVGEDGYSFTNYRSDWSPGNCYGFASTAVLYYMHYKFGDAAYPYRPMPNFTIDSTYAMQSSSDTRSALNNISFAIMLHQVHISSDGLQMRNFGALYSSICQGIPVVLAIWTSNGGYSHAVVAFDVVVDGSVADISIYDPNAPGAVQHAAYNLDNGLLVYTPTWASSFGGYTTSDFACLGAPLMNDKWFALPEYTYTRYTNNIEEFANGYYYVFSDKYVKIVTSTGQKSYFGEVGNSKSFVGGIPGSAGVSEGGYVAFAIPSNVKFRVDTDPPAGGSFVMVFYVSNETGSNTIKGAVMNVSSTDYFNYTVDVSENGLAISSVDGPALSANIQMFAIDRMGNQTFTVANVPVESLSKTALDIKDWNFVSYAANAAPVSLTVFRSCASEPFVYEIVNGADISQNAELHDNAEPTVTASVYSAYVNVASVILTGTASDNVEVAKVEASMGGSNWYTCTGTGIWWVQLSLSQGENTVLIRATDSSGHVAEASVQIAVDLTSPAVSISSPAQGAAVSKTRRIVVCGAAYDDYAVQKVEISTDGKNWAPCSGTESWSGVANLTRGTNIIFVKATDAAGNTKITTSAVSVDAGQDTAHSISGLAVQAACTIMDAIGAVGAAVLAAIFVVLAAVYWKQKLIQ